MKTRAKLSIELPRIKRTKKSWPGKVIEYLIKHPSGNPGWELAIEAIASYWLVEALEGNVDPQQMGIAIRYAIEKLSGKLATINKLINLEMPAVTHSSYIKNEPNIYVELSRIKRAKDSWEGKVIEYLMKCPSQKPCTELVIEAITSYWLVEALLDLNAEHSEVIKASRTAIEKLEAKLATIREIGKIENPQTTPPSTTTPSNLVNAMETEPQLQPELNDMDNGNHTDDDEDDEDWGDFLDDQALLLSKLLST